MPLKNPANILIHSLKHFLLPSEKIHWAFGYIFVWKSQISLNPGNSVSYLQNLKKTYFFKTEMNLEENFQISILPIYWIENI